MCLCSKYFSHQDLYSKKEFHSIIEYSIIKFKLCLLKITFYLGEIKDLLTGKVYQSKSPLTSMDCSSIANSAKGVIYLDGYVNWMTAALKLAKQEKRESKYINVIK